VIYIFEWGNKPNVRRWKDIVWPDDSYAIEYARLAECPSYYEVKVDPIFSNQTNDNGYRDCEREDLERAKPIRRRTSKRMPRRSR